METSIFELPYYELALHAEDIHKDYKGKDTLLRWTWKHLKPYKVVPFKNILQLLLN